MYVLVVFFVLFVACKSFDLPKIPCYSHFHLSDTERYNLTATFEIGDADPQDASFDAHGNLFFIKNFKHGSRDLSEICVLYAKNNKIAKIQGLPKSEAYSIAIDRADDVVYFGSTQGIYKYNYHKKIAEQFTDSELKNLNIDKERKKIVAENKNGEEQVFLLSGNKKIQLDTLDTLDEIAIDDDNNIYYIKLGQVYVLKPSMAAPICLGNIPYDGIAQISFYKDYVFIASNKLLYYQDNDTNGLKEIKNVPSRVTTIAFDHGNYIVIGMHGTLLRYQRVHCIFRKRRQHIQRSLNIGLFNTTKNM